MEERETDFTREPKTEFMNAGPQCLNRKNQTLPLEYNQDEL